MDFERITFVTRFFNSLQGLRKNLMIGASLVALAIPDFMTSRPRVQSLAVQLLVIGLAAVVSLGAGRYYEARYGVVYSRLPFAATTQRSTAIGTALAVAREPMVIPDRKKALLFLAAVCAVPLIFLGAASNMTILARHVYLFAGAALFAAWWVFWEHRASQAHYAAVATLLLLAAARGDALGLFLPASLCMGKAFLLVGGSLVLCGIVDHWQLTHTLGSLARQRTEEAR